MARRRIFVGDIQGCREPLERLLAAVHFDPAADELQPVGDFVNRGPDNVGVLRLLKQAGAGGVLGNHDVHLLRRAAGLATAKGRDTLDDVLAAPDRDELLSWLANRPFVRCWDDVLLIHGGLDPTWRDPLAILAGLDPANPGPAGNFAINVRYCAPDGRRPAADDPPPPAPFVPWFDHPRTPAVGDRTVVFGHWAVMGLVVRPRLRGLDSGCVWGRRLSAWIADEDRIVDVPYMP